MPGNEASIWYPHIPIPHSPSHSPDPVLAAEVATFMECVKLTAEQVGSILVGIICISGCTELYAVLPVVVVIVTLSQCELGIVPLRFTV